MDKRILITGSAGFVGSHLVEHLIANTSWHIIGIDSFRHRGDSLRIFQDPGRYDIYTHDLTAPISNRLQKKIKKDLTNGSSGIILYISRKEENFKK